MHTLLGENRDSFASSPQLTIFKSTTCPEMRYTIRPTLNLETFTLDKTEVCVLYSIKSDQSPNTKGREGLER